MDYYLSRNTDTVFDSVMCCGAGAGVKGLRTLFKNELQYDNDSNDMETARFRSLIREKASSFTQQFWPHRSPV